MIPSWTSLDADDRARFWAAVAFLEERLSEFETIEWALRLGAERRVEQMAVHHLLNKSPATVLDEPWAGAWRLIVDCWSEYDSEDDSNLAIYDIGERVKAGGSIGRACFSGYAPGRSSSECPIDQFRLLGRCNGAASAQVDSRTPLGQVDEWKPG